MTHNKKRIPLSNLLINYISARSPTQILSLKGECAFLFLNFQIGLCNSSANCFFEIFSFSIPLPANLFRVACVAKVSDRALIAEASQLKQVHVDIHHLSDFC